MSSERKVLFVDPEGLTDEEVAERISAFLDAEAPLPDDESEETAED